MRKLPGWSPKIPQLLVFNKIDKLEQLEGEGTDGSDAASTACDFAASTACDLIPKPEAAAAAGIIGHLEISAVTGLGLDKLMEEIEHAIVNHTDYGQFSIIILIPYTEPAEYAALKSGKHVVKITDEEPTNELSATHQCFRRCTPHAKEVQGLARTSARAFFEGRC